MHIQWLGEGGIKITTKKANDEKCVIIIDAPGAESGIKVRGGVEADIVLESHQVINPDAIPTANPHYYLGIPGEYEMQGIPCMGRLINGTIAWRSEIEGMSVGHLGALKGALTESERAMFTDMDVLLVPVGGAGVLNAKEAAELVRSLEPKIVIPLYHAMPELKTPREVVEKFIKELPCPQEQTEKVSIRNNDIPEEGMKMVILTP